MSVRRIKNMKKIIITLTLLVMAFNTFALELSDFRKSKNMEKSEVQEILDDKTYEVEKGFDWLVIPEIDTNEPELPNNEYFKEKEKETVDFIISLKNKVKSFLQNLQ
jgi:hypothetical protein